RLRGGGRCGAEAGGRRDGSSGRPHGRERGGTRDGAGPEKAPAREQAMAGQLEPSLLVAVTPTGGGRLVTLAVRFGRCPADGGREPLARWAPFACPRVSCTRPGGAPTGTRNPTRPPRP